MENKKARKNFEYKKFEEAQQRRIHNYLKYSKGTSYYFYQFRKIDTPHILYLLANHPLALKVFAVLLYCADDGTSIRYGIISVEQKYISKAVSNKKNPNNRSGVANAIHYLKKLGLIAVKRLGVNNVYILNPDFIWVLHDNQETRNEVESHVNFKNDPCDVALKNKQLCKNFAIARNHSITYTNDRLATINRNEQARKKSQ